MSENTCLVSFVQFHSYLQREGWPGICYSFMLEAEVNYSYIRDEETEEWKGLATCPESRSSLNVGAGIQA